MLKSSEEESSNFNAEIEGGEHQEEFNRLDIIINYAGYEGVPLFSNLKLSFCKGDKILITGRSGSGKSTLLSYILNLQKPEDGAIILNNKTIIKNINTKSYFEFFSYVEQSPYFEDLTLDELIIGFEEEYDRDYLDLVKQTVAIPVALPPDVVSNLMTIGEGGNKLSGGQKQRIAIARALY